MAECLFSLSVIYLLLTQFGKTRILCKYTLVAQFFVGWLVLELAWVHAVISGLLIVMALGDFNDWSFSTLVGAVISIYNIQRFMQIHQQAKDSKNVFKQAFERELGDDYRNKIADSRRKLLGLSEPHQWLKPFSFKSEQIETIRGICYGEFDRNTLDLHRPAKHQEQTKRPVMLQIHGGGWVLGHGEKQGLPLRNKLVEAGWIYVAINYRLSPKDKFPAHLIDCKQALIWIKENIAEYGGDPDFIMVTGGSAGGHLASLVALTANQETALLQPGFEDKDTSVKGAIPMYGVYDFTDGNTPDGQASLSIVPFLQKYVMPDTLSANPNLWDIASPITQANADRPPFLVIHGELDTLALVEPARSLVRELKQSSDETCIYAELPTTQHAMDIFNSPRSAHTVDAMHDFAELVYSRYLNA